MSIKKCIYSPLKNPRYATADFVYRATGRFPSLILSDIVRTPTTRLVMFKYSSLVNLTFVLRFSDDKLSYFLYYKLYCLASRSSRLPRVPL